MPKDKFSFKLDWRKGSLILKLHPVSIDISKSVIICSDHGNGGLATEGKILSYHYKT